MSMEPKKTVLIVEDEMNIVDIVRFNLQREGYATLEAYDGEAGLALAREKKPDLILLDVMMPKMMGFDVCRALRAEGDNVPVIILTAREEEEDKILGLEEGADDYLPKPFHMAELSARIRSVVRRSRGSGRSSIVLGNVTLDPEGFRVEVAGAEVVLLKKEFDILSYLMQRPGHMVDKAVLAEAVWGDHADQADNFHFVYSQMKNLRRKLEEAGATIEIKAVYGFGYKLSVTE